jgi:hypothetical protein
MDQSDKEDKVFGNRVTIPEFEIVSNPTVVISEVRRRRFNLIDRRNGGRIPVVIGH